MTKTNLSPDAFPNTLAGAGLYALAMWSYWRQYAPGDNDDAYTRGGNMQAYAAMIYQMTGRRPDDPRAHELILAASSSVPIRGDVKAGGPAHV